MNNMLKYKGYTGNVNFDADDKIFHGRIVGTTDVIGFEGASVDELESDFHEAVDDYLETCREIGKKPEKPFSGRLVVRIPSELHCAIALEAKRQERSMSPKVLEEADLVFWFHSYDALYEERASVHVDKGSQDDYNDAKVWLEPEIEVARPGRTLRRHELNWALKVIKQHHDYLLEEWYGYSGGASSETV